MKERPILFKGEMVRAILEGRKTQTRRIIKDVDDSGHTPDGNWHVEDLICPYGQPGDRLWVKETFSLEPKSYSGDKVRYRADGNPTSGAWKPSIFMPRWASRITLEIVSVRVERVQDIGEEDAKAEGSERGIWCNDGVLAEPVDEQDESRASNRHGYGFLWENINGTGSWDLNPWVWVVGFKRIQP